MHEWKTRCLSSTISIFSKFSNQNFCSLKNPLRHSEHAESLQKHPRSFLDAPRRAWRKLEISWKSLLFGVIKKYVRTKKNPPENRIDTTNAFLDRYWPKLGRKIAPEWFLFINKCYFSIFVINFRDLFVHQIESNLDARGKPSTVFPRGRLVETERTPTYEALFNK